MQAITSAELVNIIKDNVPDLVHAEESANMRLRLMSMDNYIHAGFYFQKAADEEVLLSCVNGEMKDHHVENMVDTIVEQNSTRDASGWWFILHGDGYNKFDYCHYFVTAH
jgi:hypothetical protein